MGINDRCAVGLCKNARKYPECYVIKPHIATYNTTLKLMFWRCIDLKLYSKWAQACNRKNFKFGPNNYVCSNHFKCGRPMDLDPMTTLYLMDEEVGTKRKAPKERNLEVIKTKMRKSNPQETADNKQPDVDFHISSTPKQNISEITSIAATTTFISSEISTLFTISPGSTPSLSPTESSKGLISPTVNPSPVIYLYKRMSWAAIQ